MAIRATSGNYVDPYSMYNQLLGKSNTSESSSASTLGISYGSSRGDMSGLLTTAGRKELSNALDGMKKAGYTSFTFEDIENYRKEKELAFSTQVKLELLEMGVDPDIEFRLVADTYGKVSVISSHPDKAIVEHYIAENPALQDEIKSIQALSNLKRTTQNAQIRNSEGMTALKKSLQAEAVEAFFAANDNEGKDWFSQIASFNGQEDAQYMLGLNYSA